MPTPALNSINFLRKQRQRLGAAQQRDRLFALISYCVLGVVFAVTVGVFGYGQWLKQDTEKAEDQIQREERTVASLATVEAQHLIYASRLTVVQSLFDTYTSKKQALEFITQAATAEVSFDRLSFDDENNELSFRLNARNVVAVDTFLAQLREQELRAQIDGLEVSEVKRDSSGIYQLDMKVRLVKEKRGA